MASKIRPFNTVFINNTNLTILNNLIHGSYISGVKNLIFLGSSCVYTRNSKQPIKEKYLLSSELEKTNEPYAIAKIAGIKLCESYNFQYGMNYKCLMPTNTFGPGDNYDENDSHFLPALIKKTIIPNLATVCLQMAQIQEQRNLRTQGHTHFFK